VTALLFGLRDPESSGGGGGASPPLLLLAVALFGLFVWQERRAPEPMLPLGMFRRRVMAVGTISGALIGASAFSQSTFVPPFVQGVLGRTPVEAGAAVLATSVGWSTGAVVVAFFLEHLGPRRTALAGTLCWAVGSAILVSLDRTATLPFAVAAAAILGLGMGLTIFPVVVSAQSAVGWSRRGAVTGLVDFARSMGAAIGVAALGTILFATMSATATDVQTLLDNARRAELGPERAGLIADALASGLRNVYLVMVAVTVAGALLAHRLPALLVDQRESTAASHDAVV
jgi:MYXO-CTERM domain-containing protein